MMQVGAEGSYLSQSPTDLHFGLGEAEKADLIEIVWPDGSEAKHENVTTDQIVEYVGAVQPRLLRHRDESD
ncbi:ASPIC/UnbV domain-containing protein [Novipirellula artificiosorum]|uniref:ASPIC and UnbV n=1 Tax=Novipirellula artificiosorum TaxID=2528016 RepID=A0A5C6DCF8_9BACT|nr:ASPIC/UnbV domain-containing protein [Novipirellula artificiosorum]TWU33925.1 ASPIC and UnbV [Novipirellula artificiosorum]